MFHAMVSPFIAAAGCSRQLTEFLLRSSPPLSGFSYSVEVTAYPAMKATLFLP